MENIDDNFYKVINSKELDIDKHNNDTKNNDYTGFTGNTGITGEHSGSTGPSENTGPIDSPENKCSHEHFFYQ